MIRLHILCFLSLLLVSCGSSDSIHTAQGIAFIAQSLPLRPTDEGEYPIHDFTLSYQEGFKEARIVWGITPKSKEESPLGIAVTISVAKADAVEAPYFVARVSYSPYGRGISIPLCDGNLHVSLTGRGGDAQDLTVSIAANFRKTSMFNAELTEADLRDFDTRYCNLQDNQGGLERVFEVQEDYWKTIGEPLEDVFAFQDLSELADLLSPDCTIRFIKGEEATTPSVAEFVSNIGQGHFSYALQMDNIEGPSFEIHDATSVIKSRKRIIGPKGHGGVVGVLYTWDESAVVHVKDDRIQALAIERVMLEGEKE